VGRIVIFPERNEQRTYDTDLQGAGGSGAPFDRTRRDLTSGRRAGWLAVAFLLHQLGNSPGGKKHFPKSAICTAATPEFWAQHNGSTFTTQCATCGAGAHVYTESVPQVFAANVGDFDQNTRVGRIMARQHASCQRNLFSLRGKRGLIPVLRKAETQLGVAFR
jgi:hypothetical protein